MGRPISTATWDDGSLARITTKIQSLSRTRRQLREDPTYAPALPEEIGLQLNNRCNLRCAHCYQWNEAGFHHRLPVLRQRDELDIEIIEQLLLATREVRSRLYLSGGEALLYSEWDRLAALLEADPRWTVLCTNGVGLKNKLDSLLRISENLVVLVSLDGLAEEHDAIRGAGTFARTVSSIELLLAEKARGRYRGEVSTNAILSGALAPRLYEFVEYLERLQINTAYLTFPWYMPPQVASKMDQFVLERFAWLREQNPELYAGHPSWHSYQFHLEPQHLSTLCQQMQRIAARTWRIRVRYQPALEPDEIEGFVRGSEQPAEKRTRCTSVATRMNVLPDGRVTTCKNFPELTIGRLRADSKSIGEIWKNDNFTRARGVFACGLMPVCSKCTQLYQHGL